VARWPLIEMDGGWDMAPIYYDRDERPVGTPDDTW
jgi:hypothetical protein